MASLWLIALSPFFYLSFKWLQTHYIKHTLFNPILLSLVCISLVLIYADIPYPEFAQKNQIFSWLLDLAIVALAIPLYKEFRTIKKDTWRYLVCSSVGVCVSAFVAMLVAFSLGANETLLASIAPNAVTAPIAIEVSEQLHGISALTAVVVICVGIFGAMLGLPILRLFNVHNPRDAGLALGSACHAIGTAKAIEVNESMGAFASVSLVLSAILTPIVLPITYSVFEFIFLT